MEFEIGPAGVDTRAGRETLAWALRSNRGQEDLDMALNVTMLDLVTAVGRDAESEAELIATVVYLVRTGRVRLSGNFRGCRFDTADVTAADTAGA